MQDFTAFSWVPVQRSHGTSPGSTQGCSFTRTPNRSTISTKRIFTRRSGLVRKSSLQTGHLYRTCSSQNFAIQVLQKLCPHGVETGLLNTSRHMEHEKFSSGQEVFAEAIPRHRRQGSCIEQYQYSCHSITGREVLTCLNVVLFHSPCRCFFLPDNRLRNVSYFSSEREYCFHVGWVWFL